MIGRIDFFGLKAGSHQIAYDGILAVCRRRWPQGVFLDADEDRSVPLNSRELDHRPASREFFVFDDEETAEKWDELGPCEENWNLMLHFLCDEQTGTDGTYTRVTVVVDEVTPDIQMLFEELQANFDTFGRVQREAV